MSLKIRLNNIKSTYKKWNKRIQKDGKQKEWKDVTNRYKPTESGMAS